MKAHHKLLSLLLAVLMLCMTACATVPDDRLEPPTEPQGTTTPPSSPEDPGSEKPTVTTYNIIYALATIPPVLAALDAIDSGYETYAIIERGKTYSGIDSLDYFHNVGFDVTSNQSLGFTATEFNSMVEKIKELNDAEGDAYFNFYIQDGTALRGAALAANAGLSADQFHVYMCEDGTGAYNALRASYIQGKTVNAEVDEVYDDYAARVEEMREQFNTVMAKTDNQNHDELLRYNIGKAFALAALDNFTYYLQDENIVAGILEETGEVKTRLLTSFGVEGYNHEVDLTLNLKYQKISEGVAALDETERRDYLTLMYGEYYEDTYAALTRTERGDEPAPAKKLVFIGSRHDGYLPLAAGTAYGIGGLTAGATVPATYEELDAKYKCELLFATEADYTSFLAVLNNSENYGEQVDPQAKTLAQVECFNRYINYIYNLKLVYSLYGEDYDLIMKGHPREVIGSHEEWGSRYKVTYGEEQTYVYDKLLDMALLNFHKEDSVGKYIGMVPYGTAAENLAYLGADIAIAGLPSSTYSGYDTDVDVLFIMALTNEAIDGTVSQVKERYEAGNLLYTDADGNKQTAVFYNIGNLYKTLASIYTEKGNTALAAVYTNLFRTWLTATHPGAADINSQGFAVDSSAA